MLYVELIILAALAGVVLYQLYAVLGRRVGRQPEDNAPILAGAEPLRGPQPPAVEDGTPLSGLAALRAGDPSFDVGKFLEGARGAYELIVKAFAGGDRETLKRLLSADTYTNFEAAIGAREAEGRSETVEFLHPPRADLESVEVESQIARTRVRFLAEYRARSKGPEGEAVDDRRTAEVWTFERPLASQDPNWILMRVDAAEA